MIIITVSSSEGSDINCISGPSFICQDVINLIVRRPMRRSSCVFMNVAMWVGTLYSWQISWCSNVY